MTRYADNTGFEKVAERLSKKYLLTQREVDVALRCATGQTNAEVGKKLYITEKCVRFHLTNIYSKLNIPGTRGVRKKYVLMVVVNNMVLEENGGDYPIRSEQFKNAETFPRLLTGKGIR